MFKELNVLRIFFEYPSEEFSVRGVGRQLKISPATASSFLRRLKELGFLRSRNVGGQVLYTAALENEIFRDYKKFYTVWKLRNSGFIEALREKTQAECIVLHGVGAHGFDEHEGTLSFCVVGTNGRGLETEKYEHLVNRNISVKVVSDVREIDIEELHDIVNGVVLFGALRID